MTGFLITFALFGMDDKHRNRYQKISSIKRYQQDTWPLRRDTACRKASRNIKNLQNYYIIYIIYIIKKSVMWPKNKPSQYIPIITLQGCYKPQNATHHLRAAVPQDSLCAANGIIWGTVASAMEPEDREALAERLRRRWRGNWQEDVAWG